MSSLGEKIKNYLDSQKGLSQEDKIFITDIYNDIINKIPLIRNKMHMHDRGVKLYLFDTENIGFMNHRRRRRRRRRCYWDPKWVIKTYKDFKRNNFLINNDGYNRIPIIFSYPSRKNALLKNALLKNNNIPELNDFIFPFTPLKI